MRLSVNHQLVNEVDAAFINRVHTVAQSAVCLPYVAQVELYPIVANNTDDVLASERGIVDIAVVPFAVGRLNGDGAVRHVVAGY